MSQGTWLCAQIIQRWKVNSIFRNICVRTQNTPMSLGTCSNAQIIQRWKAKIIIRNICVRTQNTVMRRNDPNNQ